MNRLGKPQQGQLCMMFNAQNRGSAMLQATNALSSVQIQPLMLRTLSLQHLFVRMPAAKMGNRNPRPVFFSLEVQL
jgi:hypothetical protein